MTEPGAMVGPTNTGFDDIYTLDPEIGWNETNQCLWRPAYTDDDGETVPAGCDYNSPRIRPMPMFDPREAPDNGRKSVPLTNFGSVFVEAPLPGQDFTAIWLGLLPSDPDTSNDPVEGLPKWIHLIR